MTNAFYTAENWESDISDVEIAVSDTDPLGYHAIFYLSDASPKNPISFKIGGSLLANRAKSLALAGYNAPMTRKAIALLESRLSTPCTA